MNENQYPAEIHDDAVDDVNGSSTLAGKYALYRPRPGRNVSPARRQSGTEADEENTAKKEDDPVAEDNTNATCPPASELTLIYENSDKVTTLTTPFFLLSLLLSLN